MSRSRTTRATFHVRFLLSPNLRAISCGSAASAPTESSNSAKAWRTPCSEVFTSSVKRWLLWLCSVFVSINSPCCQGDDSTLLGNHQGNFPRENCREILEDVLGDDYGPSTPARPHMSEASEHVPGRWAAPRRQVQRDHA